MTDRQLLDALAVAIEPLNYVVMRNWEKLPEEIDGDIDFFVDAAGYEPLKAICTQFLPPHLFDIRTVGDGYFSHAIERNLLQSMRRHHGFKVPNNFSHFMSLYYHNLVHKGDGRYDETLKKIFWQYAQPVRPSDEGVGFHGIDSHQLE